MEPNASVSKPDASSFKGVINSVLMKVNEYLENLIYVHSQAESLETAKILAILKVVKNKISDLMEDILIQELTEKGDGKDFDVSIELKKLQKKAEGFRKLVEVSLYINETLDQQTVLERILSTAKNIIGSQGCSLILVDEENPNILNFSIALGDRGNAIKQLAFNVGEGIAGTVVKTGEPLIVNDPERDERFSRKFDEVTGFLTNSILCVPIKIKEKGQLKTIGALEVVNRTDERDYYDEADKELLLALSSLAAVSIENARVYQKAITDRLTKIYNFGFFQDQLYREITFSRQCNSCFSLVMIDLDNFKHFNDNYGHQMGNVALKKVAELLKDSVRDTDIVTRYGGEEFAVILPYTSKKDAFHFAERFRKRLEQTQFLLGDGKSTCRLTASLGISSFPEDGSTLEKIISSSDSALYKAKAMGKNAIVLYSEVSSQESLR